MKIQEDELTFYYCQNKRYFCFNNGLGIEFNLGNREIINTMDSEIKIQPCVDCYSYQCFNNGKYWYCEYNRNIYKLIQNQSVFLTQLQSDMQFFAYKGLFYTIDKYSGKIFTFQNQKFYFKQDINLEVSCTNLVYSFCDRIFLVSNSHLYELVLQSFQFQKVLICDVEPTILFDSFLHISENFVVNLLNRSHHKIIYYKFDPSQFGWSISSESKTNLNIKDYRHQIQHFFRTFYIQHSKQKINLSQSADLSKINKGSYNNLVQDQIQLFSFPLSNLASINEDSSFEFSDSDSVKNLNIELSIKNDILEIKTKLVFIESMLIKLLDNK